jgi:hypothetical protein
MRRRPSTVPAIASRREVLLGAGTALALGSPYRRAKQAQSYLARLLRRREELEQLVVHFDAVASNLCRGPITSPIRKPLRAVRRAEIEASQALERLEWVIADTAAETLDDVALKLRFLAELQGYAAPPAPWRAPLTVEEQLLRTILADLKRLKETLSV